MHSHTADSSTSRKLQRLKNQLYISDNSDIENIIDEEENQYHPSSALSPYHSQTLHDDNPHYPSSSPPLLHPKSSLPSRHTRKRNRIDYNENKRVPLYVTTPTTPGTATTGRRKRQSKKNEPTASHDLAVPYEQNGIGTSNLTPDSKSNNEHAAGTKNGYHYPTASEKDAAANDKSFDNNSVKAGNNISDKREDSVEQIDSDTIDISFLRRIVETDLNKKLSVLGDSEIVVTTHSIPLKTTIRKDTIEPFNESYMDETFNEDQDHETFSGSVEDESQSHTDSTPPPQSEEFTDTINEEVKSKYEKLSRSIINDKQRQINSTITSIDKEINSLKLKYSHFKHNIHNLGAKTRLQAGSRQRAKTIGTTVRPISFKPSFYPELFLKQFQETGKKIHVESDLMSYLLAKSQTDKKINTEIITGRHISSFNENRESMKYFLRDKIWRLDDELQRRVGGTEIVALANVAAMMDWSETNKLVNDAEKKLFDGGDDDDDDDDEDDDEDENSTDGDEGDDDEEVVVV